MSSALLFVFPAIMAFGAAMDLLTMTIPNRISLFCIAAFLVAAPLSGISFHDFLMHLAAGATVLAAGIVLFAYGGFGGGDAKLLAAASLWIGFEHLLPFLVAVSIFGGLLAIVLLLYRKMPPLLAVPDWASRLHERGSGIPYGIAIAAGALAIYPKTFWFPALVG